MLSEDSAEMKMNVKKIICDLIFRTSMPVQKQSSILIPSNSTSSSFPVNSLYLHTNQKSQLSLTLTVCKYLAADRQPQLLVNNKLTFFCLAGSPCENGELWIFAIIWSGTELPEVVLTTTPRLSYNWIRVVPTSNIKEPRTLLREN